MEMHEIKYFLAACRTLNFHRAAELGHVSQPALTRAIQKLEAELGGHLFHRERSQIRLTDFGRLMRAHLEQVLRQTDTAKVAAKSFLKLEEAPLTLGVMCTIGPLRFVGFLNDFREQHPGIEVSVIENVPGRLSELLLAGTLDIAVMAQPMRGSTWRQSSGSVSAWPSRLAIHLSNEYAACDRRSRRELFVTH